MAESKDFTTLPSVYERVTSATETPAELQHKLHLEKARFYASLGGVFLVFCVLTGGIFFHEDPALRQSSQTLLQALAAGFIGYIVRR